MCELKSEGFFTMADKQKALDTALAQIEKQYGKGAIMRLGQNNGMNVASIPTGSISLDVATGIGGLPRGRIIEIYGPESSGKPPLRCMSSPRLRRPGEKPHLSMRSMRLIRSMQKISAWM